MTPDLLTTLQNLFPGALAPPDANAKGYVCIEAYAGSEEVRLYVRRCEARVTARRVRTALKRHCRHTGWLLLVVEINRRTTNRQLLCWQEHPEERRPFGWLKSAASHTSVYTTGGEPRPDIYPPKELNLTDPQPRLQ